MGDIKRVNDLNSALDSELKESSLSISDFEETGEIADQSDNSLTRVVRNKKSFRLFKLKSISKPLSHDSIGLIDRLELARSLAHPNINRVYQRFEDSKAIHFLLEYVPNHSLYLDILMNESISDEDALTYFDQIKNAMDYLHSQNLFLRSLNPENIFIRDNKQIVFTESVFMSEISVYTPPEGWGSKEADIWASGLLMFEITQGLTPFEQPVSKNSTHFELTFNRSVCNKLEEFIRNSLKINPSERNLREQGRNLESFPTTSGLTRKEVCKRKTINRLERYLNCKRKNTQPSTHKKLTPAPSLDFRSTKNTEDVSVKSDKQSLLKFDDDDLVNMLNEYQNVEGPPQPQKKGMFSWIKKIF